MQGLNATFISKFILLHSSIKLVQFAQNSLGILKNVLKLQNDIKLTNYLPGKPPGCLFTPTSFITNEMDYHSVLVNTCSINLCFKMRVIKLKWVPHSCVKSLPISCGDEYSDELLKKYVIFFINKFQKSCNFIYL